MFILGHNVCFMWTAVAGETNRINAKTLAAPLFYSLANKGFELNISTHLTRVIMLRISSITVHYFLLQHVNML